jgi:hypothetical protein
MPPLNWRLSIEGGPTLIVDAVGAILGANAVAVSGAALIFIKTVGLKSPGAGANGQSDTVFSFLSAPVLKTAPGGQ